MYNLNVNVSTSASSLAVESSCTTPKTPEILNSLIAMSSPFESYPSGPQHHHLGGPRVASSPPEGGSFAHPGCSSMPPPSVQHTCSQLIKEGLKLTLQSKRKLVDSSSPLDPGSSFCKIPKLQFTPPGCGGVGSSGDDEVSLSSPESSWLTAEDAERRRRRRERNKIAATKCRLKKREKTVILVQESEVLENQNHDLKSQIQDLENQRRRLMDMLSMHNQTCVKNVSGASSGHHYVPPSEHHHLPPPQHHPQQQQQHYVGPGYQHYPPQESPPPPGPYSEVGYSVQQQQQSGMDSGCLA